MLRATTVLMIIGTLLTLFNDNPNNLKNWTNAAIFPKNTANNDINLRVRGVPQSYSLSELLAFSGALLITLKWKGKSAVK